MLDDTRGSSKLVDTRRRWFVGASLCSLLAAGGIRKALAEEFNQHIALVYDAQWITPAMVNRMLHYAGGEQSIRRNGFTLDHLTVSVGDNPALKQLVRKVESDPPNLFVVLGDDEVLAIHRAVPHIPMVFWCNTDPTSTGLARTLRMPGKLATGATSDWVENVKPLEFLNEIIGVGSSVSGKRVGVFANNYWFAEARRLAWLAAANTLGFELVFVAVENYTQLAESTEWNAVQQFDAVVLPLSTSTVTDDAKMVRHLQDRDVLSLFENFTSLTVGAPLGYEHNRIDWQAQLGQTLALVIQGVPVGEIPVRGPEGWEYAVNKSSLQQFGFELSPQVASQIVRVF